MKKRSVINKIMDGCKLMLAAILLLFVQSCIMDSLDEPQKDPTIILSLQVVAESNSITRAGHIDDAQEGGLADENYINIVEAQDMRVFLFTKTGQFIMEVTGLQWQLQNGFNSNIYSSDEKQIFFPDDTDEQKAVIESVKRDGVDVMVLANSYNAGWNGSTTNFPGSFTQLWKDGNNFNFNYTPTISGGGNNTVNQTWTPSATDNPKRLIPMFGYKHVNFYSTATGNNKTFAVITMQRAMAKVEVIDNIESTIKEGVTIGDVSLSKYNMAGRLIPDIERNPSWNVIGSQVGVSSLPDNPQERNTLKFFNFPKTSTSKSTWVAYIPEMELAKPNPNGTLPEDRTHINLQISSPNYPSFHNKSYSVHFASYDGDNVTPKIPDESWNHILRNHIYRYSVNNVGVNAELDLHVIPWQLDEDETWDFSDNVTVQSQLEWLPVNYENSDDWTDPGGSGGGSGDVMMTYDELQRESGRVILWIDEDKSKILTGRFAISTPVNGKWYARLTPLDGALSNSITFVDADGVPMTPAEGNPPVCLEVSGFIAEGFPATIRIAPTNFGNEQESQYKLEFFVENLGTWTRVSMVDKYRPDGATWDYFTIVRKNNRIQ